MTRRDLEDLDRLVLDYKAVDQKCGESEDAFCRWSTVRRRLADHLIQNVDEVMRALREDAAFRIIIGDQGEDN